MKKGAKDLKQWLIWQLRRLSYRWPARQQAFRNAQVTPLKRSLVLKKYPRCRNFYQCAICDEIFSRKQVSADHIQPVVDLKKGWESFDIFLTRLFCDADGFQIICNDCHDDKTAKERKVRTKWRKLRKEAA